MSSQHLIVHHWGRAEYLDVWRAMSDFTNQRDADAVDQLWLVEHPPVFTLGQAGRAEHVLAPGDIPVVQCDRGGQVTYHGPGQLVAYPLLNLTRRKMGVRELVTLIEQTLINTLAACGIPAQRREGAPGVYTPDAQGAKIAALGLRVRRGCSFHGMSLNVAMDLSPFDRINPCGYPGQAVTRMADHMAEAPSLDTAGEQLIHHFCRALGYEIPGYEPKAVRETPTE